MSFDIDYLRADTPGCLNTAFFNHCGASLMPKPVVEAVVAHTQLESEIGGYEAAKFRALTLEDTYSQVASLVNCEVGEVALTESATVAWSRAVYALAEDMEPGDKILTCVASYASNALTFMQLAKRKGIVVEVVPDDDHGQLDVNELARRIDKQTALVALTHVPTNGGLVNPAVAVGKLCNDAGVFYMLDACQSVGQMPVDVAEIGCDMLSATGRKYLRGPRGTGFLVISEQLATTLEPHTIDLRSANWVSKNKFEWAASARRFETWECSVAGRLGLREALWYASAIGLDVIEKRIASLAGQLRAGLRSIPRVVVRDKGLRQCGIVTFTHDRWRPEALRDQLGALGFRLGVSDAGSCRFDMDARGLDALVRVGVHYLNTPDEIDRLLAAVEGLGQTARGPGPVPEDVL